MRLIRILSCAWLALPLLAWAQPAAEIVSIKGKGEYTATPTAGWTPARVQQKVEAGTWLRTAQDSRMALLLADRTNANIDANSTLQLKSPDSGGPKRSIIDFQKGKGRFETKTPTKSFAVGTPTGLAAIRGTEWLVEVQDDGLSLFTVVEGEIEISNDLGTLSVGSDEQGVLERGKAPYKRTLQNARERVQWVGSFTIDPNAYPELRPGGAAATRLGTPLASLADGDIDRARSALVDLTARDDTPVAAWYLLADVALYRGEPRAAAEWLRKAAERFPNESRTLGLLARAHLYADDMALAREAAAAARARHPDTLESQLYAAEVARLDGEARLALAALRAATRIAPEDWRAWHALGQFHAERSDPRRARRALERAGGLSPRNALVLGERGMLEANAYDLEAARGMLDQAVAAGPSDFATWVGLGVARLKSGNLDGALEALRKATLLEPRYARAHVYLAVAYWQQGRAQDALAELRTASVHDPRDPLPHQFAAMIQSDLLRPGDAVGSALEALARLRYTKSLDAVANNLRGSANLGAPLAQLGLESWALKNAQDSFDPLWAGSHLFLADRLGSKYAANSELMQGFLADPLAFGAPNRFQPLVSRPGNHGTLAWRGAQDSRSTLVEPLVNANGLVGDGRFAYFVEGARLMAWPDDRATDDRASSVTAALGARLRDDLGFFVYHNRLVPRSLVGHEGRGPFDPFQRIGGAADRTDGGLMYRHGPDTQLWIKGGHGSEDSTLESREVTVLGNLGLFRDSDFITQPRRSDVGGRGLHRFANGTELSFTLERTTFRSIDFLERDAFPRASLAGTRLLESVRQDIRDTSRGGEIALRTPTGRALLAEVQVDHTRYEKTNDILVRRDFAQQLVPLDDDHSLSRLSPRAGLAWKPLEPLTLRAAFQRWLKPASTGSLRPTSTAGIVVDDRYLLPGGLQDRVRAQAEWQAGTRFLATAFYDRQEVDNLYSSLIGVLNNRPDASNLERLRNRSFNALAALDRLEGFAELSRGELTERGLTANLMATRQVSLFAEATWATSENTGEAHAGKQLAFLPKRRYAFGATCFSDRRAFVAAKAIYRSERFADEGNAIRLPAEWSGALQGYWESPSKRLSIELIIAGIGAKSADESVGVAVNYRF
ncbi:MAG TPA: tetratricopeptide repeat protein [Usitatibacter sp.]|nr:tetratricopeptide repeat protein [Usitatibacter sp.]